MVGISVINVARILSPVESLGPGRRLCIWTGGCKTARDGQPCDGCISRDLWPASSGREYEAEVLAETLAQRMIGEELTGLTVSGGEPLDQSDGLCALVAGVRERLEGEHIGADTLLFTHYDSDVVEAEYADIWKLFDVIICGRYVAGSPSTEPLLGSTNQKIVVRTEAAHARYAELEKMPRLQAFVMDGDLVLAGIPAPGDMEKLMGSMKQRGIEFGSVSWRE
jgi:anaerobic ribonucleoside-triphosphate reductase activating protein